jgi:hypothetical protein
MQFGNDRDGSDSDFPAPKRNFRCAPGSGHRGRTRIAVYSASAPWIAPSPTSTPASPPGDAKVGEGHGVIVRGSDHRAHSNAWHLAPPLLGIYRICHPQLGAVDDRQAVLLRELRLGRAGGQASRPERRLCVIPTAPVPKCGERSKRSAGSAEAPGKNKIREVRGEPNGKITAQKCGSLWTSGDQYFSTPASSRSAPPTHGSPLAGAVDLGVVRRGDGAALAAPLAGKMSEARRQSAHLPPQTIGRRALSRCRDQSGCIASH